MAAPATVRGREADLLRAATRLFRERGFHDTSMQDLAEALGMNRGSLYHYIESKDDLLWSILTNALDLLTVRVEPMLTAAGVDPARRLADGIREHLRVAAEYADELSLIQIELRALGADRRREMIRRRNRYEELWRAALREGIAAGAFRADADVRLSVIGILSACNWFTQWYREDGPMGVDQIADGFIALFLQGLRSAEARR